MKVCGHRPLHTSRTEEIIQKERSRRVLIFLKHEKGRMRAQQQSFVRSVVLDKTSVNGWDNVFYLN